MTTGLIIWKGFVYGMTLTIMLGPIFVALTQTGIEKGLRAGILVGTGIWTSDILIISLLYIFIGGVEPEYFEGDFKRYFGLIGGLILMAFGIGSSLKKNNFINEKTSFSAKSIGGYWLKGFLVNTVNPFTFIFWTTMITAYVIVKGLNQHEILLFFGTIMATIMITDTMKVMGAKLIRNKLSIEKVNIISKIAGVGLVLLGIGLIVRSW